MNLLSKIDIRQLQVLKALLEKRNLSKVADQLGISQQAVSEQLKKLRHNFDDRLFIRTSNGVVPTPFAQSLQVKVTRALASIEDLLVAEEFDPKTISTTFTICSTDLEQTVILPKFLTLLRKHAPKVKLAVKTLSLDDIDSSLLTGKVDLVITNPMFAPNNYPSTTLYQEQYLCVASKDNQDIAVQSSISDVAKIPQLVVSPSRGEFSGAANKWFADQGHPRNVVLSVPTFTAAKACIAHSDLCGFIPARLLPDPTLKIISLDKQVPGFDVIAVWHQRSSQDKLHTYIRELLMQAASE
ncbi:LysR family transcriptional regulator [Thalassotalea euphylliae]|uniref:LysR family transcriptional regulator n=1 Tax=Thalassotalea euphylliae TaxID=1655234 RepID=A0A3E0UL88_9GAMM|nr:LysR family transcriptional regulator [Thalassotalea euphylliae]REL37407.1 LysR family transcriptional regulator [Thalassotalea euphylliae]